VTCSPPGLAIPGTGETYAPVEVRYIADGTFRTDYILSP